MKHASSELDTDQGEGITRKSKFAVKQLNDKTQLHTSGISDWFSELPTTPKHDQMLVNQSNEVPVSPQAKNHFSKLFKQNDLLLSQKIMHRRI